MHIGFKTVTYTLMHMTIAFLIAWVVSGSLSVALGISLIEPLFQVAGYYFHEHAWSKFGKKPVDHHTVENVSCIAPCCAPTLVEKIKKIKIFRRAA